MNLATGCLEWTGYKRKDGYGLLGFKVGEQQRYAHRLAWEVTFGPPPAELEVCHHCDNPSCVNPDHLFLGTHHDNMLDMTRKGRHGMQGRKSTLRRGNDGRFLKHSAGR